MLFICATDIHGCQKKAQQIHKTLLEKWNYILVTDCMLLEENRLEAENWRQGEKHLKKYIIFVGLFLGLLGFAIILTLPPVLQHDTVF